MGKLIKSFSVLILALAMVVSVAVIPSSAAAVKINKTSVTLVKGYSTTLKISGTSKTVKWSSQDSTIASVSSKGKVTAKKSGTTYIVAKVNNQTLKCKVKVVLGKISVGKSSISLDKGKSVKVKITAVGSHTLGVSSSNKNVAKASWNNAKWNGNTIYLTIKGVSSGETKIKVYSKKYPNSVYKYITVKVNGSSSGNSANKTTVTVDFGEYESAEDLSDPTAGMSYAEQVLYYCNIEREKAGVAPLTLDPVLCSAADVRAQEIVTCWDHTRPDGRSCYTAMDEVGYSYWAAGENIAYGSNSAEYIVDMWMNSPGHRANILDSGFTHLGVGKSGVYWVQMFAYPK